MSVVLGAVCGVVTALVTTHPSRGLWVSLSVLVAAGAASQTLVTLGDRRDRGRLEALGAGSVVVRGTARGPITTRVRGEQVPPATSRGHDEVIALGPGAVSIDGDAGPVSTDVASDREHPGGLDGTR